MTRTPPSPAPPRTPAAGASAAGAPAAGASAAGASTGRPAGAFPADAATAPASAGPGLAALTPGQRLARGVCRALAARGFACLEEVTPTPGLRVDVMALGPDGSFWVIECKSGPADFRADRKWQGYLDWCDRFFWAVAPEFPVELLPGDTGLILADAFDAELVREGPESRLAPARRKALLGLFARQAARRLHSLRDPGASLPGG